MNRKIEFRAWDKEDKRMIIHEQDFIPLKITNFGVFRLDAQIKEDRWIILPIERFEIMQFTGLIDKNGKKIYEGDIVRYKIVTFNGNDEEEKYAIQEVIYDQDICGFDPCYAYEIEKVLGNIYENPELLTND